MIHPIDHSRTKLKVTLESGDFKAKVYYTPEWDEYQVLFFVKGKHLKHGDYFTTDKEDAEGTAVDSLKRLAK